MNIEKIELSPSLNHILPTISFEIKISRQRYQEAIIGIYGMIKTDDKKVIANFNEFPLKQNLLEELGARGSYHDKEFKYEIFTTKALATIDKRAIEYIEKRRMTNKEHDVKLNICLIVKYIESNATIFNIWCVDPKKHQISPIKIATSRQLEEANIVVHTFDPNYYPGQANNWIISGDSKHVFLSIKEQILNKEIRIPSSDWINKFAPKLELGEYFIVEIPKGKKIIKDAWKYIEDAEKYFLNWNHKGVYDNCREIGVLLDQVLKKKIGKKSFNYEERWGRTYQKFNHFASLGLHLENLKQSQKYTSDDVKIGKIDAEHILNYTKILIKYAEELLEEG